jgi:hypothetical protein
VVLGADVRAVRDFRAWSERESRRRACTDCLAALLQGRTDYLGRKDPTRWRRGDVRAVLYDLAVPRLSEICDLTAHAVPALAAYLSFLEETDRLHPGSAAVRFLHQELAQHASGFPAAMADRSRFRLAKTLYRAMLADGVDLDDDEAVNGWTAGFNRAPEHERVAVLEYLLPDQPELLRADFAARAGKVAALAPGQAPFDSRRLLPADERAPETLPVFAPVDVPSPAGAAEAARRSRVLGDLLALARWVGQGRKVTKDGHPVPADVRALTELLGLGLPGVKISHLYHARELHELFWLARQLELVDLRRSGLVAGPVLAAWQHDDALTVRSDSEVLDLWRQVFTLIETGQQVPPEAASTNAPLDGIHAVTQRCVPEMMVSLYHTAALVTDKPVAALIWPHVEELLGHRPTGLMDDGEEEMVDVAVRVALCLTLDRLIDHGTLEITGLRPTEQEAAAELTPSGLPMRAVLLAGSDQASIRLTALGRWAMREVLLAEGADAPATATNDNAPAVLDLGSVGIPTAEVARQ